MRPFATRLVPCIAVLVLGSQGGVHVAAADELTSPPPPPLERFELRRNTGLAVAGFAVFGGVYTASSIIGLSAGDTRVLVPVAGPIWTAATLDTKGYLGDTLAPIARAMLALDASLQLGGLVMAVVGATTHRAVRVGPVRVLPSASATGAGLALVGRF
jgi:hypothetical protein